MTEDQINDIRRELRSISAGVPGTDALKTVCYALLDDVIALGLQLEELNEMTKTALREMTKTALREAMDEIAANRTALGSITNQKTAKR